MDKEKNSHKHTEGTASASLLSIRGLSVAYDGCTVFHDANLEVYEHNFLDTIGPNGGGKTTLIKCILGLFRPTGGKIVKHYGSPTTGYLPQYSSVDRSFPILILGVILSGLNSRKSLIGCFDDHQRERARQVILRMGPKGLEHCAIEQLSGRQLQRALLGRTIISDPQLLILDEPGIYIGKRFEARLYRLLAEINRDCAIILASHDIGTVLQQVKNIACVSGTLGYHPTVSVNTEWLERDFNCPVELLEHGTPPHRVLGPYCHCHENDKAWRRTPYPIQKLRPTLLHLSCKVVQGGVFTQSSFLSQGTIVSLHRKARFPRVRKTSFSRIRL